MTYKWDILPLGEVAEIIGGGTPSTKEAKFWDGEVPWITPKDLSGHTSVFIAQGERFITEEGLAKSSAKLIPGNSVLYTSRAPIGYVAINTQQVTTNQGFKSFVPKAGFDYKYLYYLLKASKKEVLAFASGGTFAEIGAAAISQVQLPFPPIDVQKAIGNMLLNLDLTIEANQQTALRLEQIAQTIFKSWFVDFEPVHAKARGEQPEGMDAETAALFPDSFEDSKLGPIPAGWAASTIGETSRLVMGQSPPGESYNESGEGLPFYQGRTDFGFRFPSERIYTTAGKRLAKAGDTLISVRAPVGDANQALTDCVVGRGVAALRHNSNSEIYTYSLLKSLRPQLEYFNGEGTVFGAINRKDFEELPVVEPPSMLVEKFENALGSSNALIRNLHEQNLSLTSLRDLLLPRLISGELEIPEELLGE